MDNKGLIEATVNLIEMDAIAGFVSIDVSIKKNRLTGPFRRVRGKRRLKIYFEKKGDVIDPSNRENIKKSNILLLDKGSIVLFSIAKREGDGSYVPESVYVKKF